MINSDSYYNNIKQIIRELGPDIFLALPFSILSLDVILSPVFIVRVSGKHMMFGLKVKGKMISLMFS